MFSPDLEYTFDAWVYSSVCCAARLIFNPFRFQARRWSTSSASVYRLNDENKLDIKKHGGIHALIRRLKRTKDEMTKENITAVLWNLSSCEDI